MSISPVQSGSRAAALTGPNSDRSQMGKMDFLQILVTQLRYQDPMNPVDDREFAAQLAQFSALEQMAEQTRWAQMSYGLGLVGQRILYNTGEEGVGSGVVRSLKVVDGKPVLSVGDTEVKIDQVLEAIR